MALGGAVHTSGQYGNMTAATIAAAETVTTTPIESLTGAKYLVAQAKFVYAAGGTTCKAFVQTSLDQGVTWIDIMCFAFTTATASKVSAVSSDIALTAGTTPGDGTLADNTIVNGLLGDRFRVKYISTGTYTGATTLEVDYVAKG
jgi:hypothetical protein